MIVLPDLLFLQLLKEPLARSPLCFIQKVKKCLYTHIYTCRTQIARREERKRKTEIEKIERGREKE